MSRVEEAQAWFLFFRDYTIAPPQPRQRTYLPLLDPEICRVRHGWQREGGMSLWILTNEAEKEQ